MSPTRTLQYHTRAVAIAVDRLIDAELPTARHDEVPIHLFAALCQACLLSDGRYGELIDQRTVMRGFTKHKDLVVVGMRPRR